MSDTMTLMGWNLVMVALLSVVVWLASHTRWLRQRPAVCHVLWLLVLVKMVTPPLVPLAVLPAAVAEPHGQTRSSAAPADANLAVDVDVLTVDATDSASLSEARDASAAPMPAIAVTSTSATEPEGVVRLLVWPTLSEVLVGLSLLVSSVVVLGAIRQAARVGRLLRNHVGSSDRAAVALRTVAAAFGVRREPKLVIVEHSVAPLLWSGPGGSTIVLPRQAVDSLNEVELQSVIAHELAHFVRRDHWTNWFAFLVTSVFWWNPCAWLARREMRDAAEACCDALVLKEFPDSRRAYARTLLAIVDFVTANRPIAPSLAVTFGECRSLRRRIAMVANTSVVPNLSVTGWMLVALASLTVLLAPVRARETPDLPPTAVKAASADEPANAKDSNAVDGPPTFPEKVAPDEIAGVVVDADGKPLAGVLVDAWTWHPGNETKTDKQGIFRLKLRDERRKAEVRFSKEGYSPHYILQQPPGVNDLLVTLGNRTYIEGVLRDSDGKPVVNATIRGEQGAQRADGVVISDVTTTTKTDADGHYRLYVFPDRYEIKVAVPGVGVSRISGVEVAADQAKPLDIQLQPGVRFEAQVVEAGSSKPVKDFVLWNWRDWSVLGISDEKGRIVIEGMLPGDYHFNVGHGEPVVRAWGKMYEHGELGRWWSDDCIDQWSRKQVFDDGWQRNIDDLSFHLSVGMDPVTIQVERGVVFSGHVYDPDGKPVAGATVAPAKTGSGNSLTGDTRYSVETKKDGSYRVVMPAGNAFQYNLVAHDGKYSKWRKWANAVSEPLETRPGQQIDNFDFTLNRGATVRGRVVAEGDRVIGKREVRGDAADLKGSRYYDPTVRVKQDGSFELKFIRPGKHYIQVDPFWLAAASAPDGTSVLVDLAEGEVREGVELHVAPSSAPVQPGLSTRTFRVKVLDAAGRPMPNQRVAISSDINRANLGFLVGDRVGLAHRFEKALPGTKSFATGAQGVVEISGKSLFNEQSNPAIAVAIDPVNLTGAIGTLYSDLRDPEITLHMSPLCEVTVPVSTDDLPAASGDEQFFVNTENATVLSTKITAEKTVIQLPAGSFRLTALATWAQPQTVELKILADKPEMQLDWIRFEPTHLAMLIGRPAPDLRGIAAWHNGEAVTLADLRGKVVVLDFWGYWCGPCLASMPNLMKIHDAYSPDEVVIIAVHDASVETIDELLKKVEHARTQLWGDRKLPFRIALCAKQAAEIKGTGARVNARAIADYGITAFPTTLLIDKQGTLVAPLNAHDVAGTKRQIDRLLGK